MPKYEPLPVAPSVIFAGGFFIKIQNLRYCAAERNKMTIFHESGIPPNPNTLLSDWPSALRWCLTVMDDNDTSMSFMAGCLSYVTKPTGDGKLTDRQERGCQKVLDRLVAQFDTLQLDCVAFPFGDRNG